MLEEEMPAGTPRPPSLDDAAVALRRRKFTPLLRHRSVCRMAPKAMDATSGRTLLRDPQS
jgi:hypothetical protein